ncbi:hypothetical protein NITMOv2_1660 [Nitrospira moscoviensis]|uniref:Uncharacterized protein n=1 Tax=Nitrospira moscoviensis TaxID=42253 RepID=A0A0K2GAW1_NITMO|nr:hypothetical protein NITMOv2_1660 [Nitrospira moscoviensis]
MVVLLACQDRNDTPATVTTNLGVTNYSPADYSTLKLAQSLASLPVVSHPPGANRSSQSDERL